MAAPEVTAISRETCARFADGLLKCWGGNTAGELGQGDGDNRGDDPNEMGNALPAINLGAGLTAAAIAGGTGFMCAVLNDGNVKCWGQNLHGQLGLGNTDGRGDDANEMGDSLPAVDLGLNKLAKALGGGGEQHMCAILLDDSVKCWGANLWGQLGLGDKVSRGYGPGQMGDVLPTVNLGTGLTAKALRGGFGHMCARLSDDSLKCWGFNNYGELGLGDTANRGDGPNEMGDNLPVVDLGAGKKAKAIASAENHVCVILDNDSVKCWGRNTHGQLGLGDTANRGDAPSEMGNSLLPVNLGSGKTAKAIAAGALHTCALLNDDSVKCWGSNFHGQLGLGDTEDRGDEPNEMGDNLPAVDLGSGKTATAITAGYQHTCAVLNDNSVKCWGHNLLGELGIGDAVNRGDGPNEMGDNLPAVPLP
jgi:alpha-tubulin suppressor-like RCC1 family protein